MINIVPIESYLSDKNSSTFKKIASLGSETAIAGNFVIKENISTIAFLLNCVCQFFSICLTYVRRKVIAEKLDLNNKIVMHCNTAELVQICDIVGIFIAISTEYRQFCGF